MKLGENIVLVEHGRGALIVSCRASFWLAGRVSGGEDYWLRSGLCLVGRAR